MAGRHHLHLLLLLMACQAGLLLLQLRRRLAPAVCRASSSLRV
jgi:hypothetical protein